MITTGTGSSDPRARLALGCSALARAGQVLSTAGTPDQARAALRQVAAQLQSDRNLASLVATADLARRCVEAADQADGPQVLVASRQMATSLARQASSLATEVQQKSAGAGARPVATSVPQPAPVSERAPSVEPTAEAEVVEPEVAAVPEVVRREPVPIAPVPAVGRAEPDLDDPAVRRVSVARTLAERGAVAQALAGGRRFAVVGNGTLVDTRLNLMWGAGPMVAMGHRQAVELAARCGEGGYSDWRLPTVEELRGLLAQDGVRALLEERVLAGSGSGRVWSAQVRSRFLGLLKDAAVVDLGTGEVAHCSRGSGQVFALPVRG